MTISLGARAAAATSLLAAGLVTGLGATAAHADTTVIHFSGYHAVNSMATARKWLPGTSPAFKRFAAREGRSVQDYEISVHASKSCIAQAGVMVTDYVDGYAIGSSGGCGGYAALWTNRTRGATGTTAWREVWGTQDAWYCPPLKRYHFPSALVGDTCYSPKLKKDLPYHQA
jgi:hypothetical protein